MATGDEAKAPPPGPLGGGLRLLGRAAREPLLQFLAAAAVLFGLNFLIHGPEQAKSTDSIVVSEGRVQQIADSYRLLAGRLPTPEELEGLVDDFITEEIDYREAVAMGLDAEDTIVRRRMRQKLEFLVEDAGATDEPTEADLQGWLKDHASDYVLPPRYAIRQVLASGDKRGRAAVADAQAMLAKLKGGANPEAVGDPTMLPAATPLLSEQGVAALFGAMFAREVFHQSAEGWFGPIQSEFGEHAVEIIQREAGRAPTLDEVRDKVRSDWIEARRNKVRDESQAKLRARYDVKIEWPAAYKGLPERPNPSPTTRRLGEAGEE